MVEGRRLFKDEGRIPDVEELPLLGVRASRRDVLACLLPLAIELGPISIKGECVDLEVAAMDAFTQYRPIEEKL